jgi:DNA polymerase
VHVLGQRAVRLFPIYHPAAALYTPSMLETLRADFARLPELLAQPAPEQPPPAEEIESLPQPEPAQPVEPQSEAEDAGAEPAAPDWAEQPGADQLDLF